MTIRALDRPGILLTRHFFGRLFDFELMSESASGSLARTVIGFAAVIASLGALLARMSMNRYAMLRESNDAVFFEATILNDHTFMLGAPMWIVAVVAVLTGPSLFPDETDFRVLTPTPVQRRTVFGAKLAALGLFAGIFLAMAMVAVLPSFLLTTFGRLAKETMLAQVAAFLAAGVLGGLFAAVAVTAVHAVALLVIPRERILPVSAALTSVMLFALVMALPFVGRVPSFMASFERGDSWLYLFPPAWFTGVERVLLGDSRFATLALSAVGAFVIVSAIASAAYLALYRDFSRVMTRPASDQGERLSSSPAQGMRTAGRTAFGAVRAFTSVTLRRSPLHQGVFVAIFALGAALVANSLLDADFSAVRPRDRQRLVDVVVWAPFALSFVAILAARAALILPIDLRANWVFRLTEHPAHRGDQLDAAVATVVQLGVILPALLLLPFQWLALGPASVLSTSVTVLCGWLLAEALLVDWRRIPFTCSYTVGRGFIPQLVLLGLLLFIGYTTVGHLLAYGSAVRPVAFGPIVIVLLTLVALALRRHRRGWSNQEALLFDDALPTEANPLRLSGD